MDILKSIVDKLKLKELLAIVFIASLVLTLLPEKWAVKINVYEFRNSYQTYISIGMIILGSYYLFRIVEWLIRCLKRRIYNEKRIALKYMKDNMSSDEKQLLIEAFYDENNECFHTTGGIEINDGRKAALESRYIIYRASSISSYFTTFAYNLQPHALEYLNTNLKNGNIQIGKQSYKFDLK